MASIEIEPVGIVRSACREVAEVPAGGCRASIEIFLPYREALTGVQEHSHFWVLSWFHRARRDLLKTVPYRVNRDLPEYGVFGLRTPVRPNPVGLSLVRLTGVEGNVLHVEGLDAIDGTPVIDLKPYFEQDIVFSPKTPYIKPLEKKKLWEARKKEALNHHQEECKDLLLAVRMALAAEERFGQLNCPQLLVEVVGSPCLGDVVQGLTRARLSNPPRFKHQPSCSVAFSVWTRGNNRLVIKQAAEVEMERIEGAPDHELFEITER
ncbi:MAG: tRNA (N6-threonylcarbamoyladenosine(37)-N6)-methyltransferase TrmO [Peptococcaceae bacterium]|nr:tRNA (N6-threonylcarbamoyladenosine(37)-N6)-methyltransferase TrmO [Peptococcaceae bacterium]MDH7525048.1 tRNA (N6-threonylcarbamoyladenosine(37)-N6)-methyltransferase TrmO [Peptococcaceae bacterium]